MRSLISIAFFSLTLSCFSQSQTPIPIDIILHGAETVPEHVKEQIIGSVRKDYTDPQQIEYGLAERLRDEFQQYGYFKAEVNGPENWPPQTPPKDGEPIRVSFK